MNGPRILNLYAGLGGNRELWGSDVSVTAVELDPAIAGVYASRFPDDETVVGDAHDFLLHRFRDFDIIWSSPPCPTHGQYRFNVGVKAKGYAPAFPNMELYEEIIFLKHHHAGQWVVENVAPYYEPLVAPTVRLQRHLIWSNFDIPARDFGAKGIRYKSKISDYADRGISLDGTGVTNKRQALRNLVDGEMGAHVLRAALGDTDQLVADELTLWGGVA